MPHAFGYRTQQSQSYRNAGNYIRIDRFGPNQDYVQRFRQIIRPREMPDARQPDCPGRAVPRAMPGRVIFGVLWNAPRSHASAIISPA